MYAMIIYHPWIEEQLMLLDGSSSSSSSSSFIGISSLSFVLFGHASNAVANGVGSVGGVGVNTMDGGAVNTNHLVVGDPMTSGGSSIHYDDGVTMKKNDWMHQYNNGYEDHSSSSCAAPPSTFYMDHNDDDYGNDHHGNDSWQQYHAIIEMDDNITSVKDYGEDFDGMKLTLNDSDEEEDGYNEEMMEETANTTSNDDIVCVNCHALFRIHVDVTFQGQVDSTSSSSSSLTAAAMNQQHHHDGGDEYVNSITKNWFITLRDVTHDDYDRMMYVQIDEPIDLRCDSSTITEKKSSSIKRSSNINGVDDNMVSLMKKKMCQSTSIIEVPYTSFFTCNMTSTGSQHYYYHEMIDERIILVSLLREEWSNSNVNITKRKRKRIVDQWMINIIVPPNAGQAIRAPFHSSIYSAKLRDTIVYDIMVDEDSMKEITSSSESKSSMSETIMACLVGTICGIVILVFAMYRRVEEDDEDIDNEQIEAHESQLLTPPIVQQPNSPGLSPDTQEARSNSTPTNLSPMFEDEVDDNSSEVGSTHEDEVERSDVDDNEGADDDSVEGSDIGDAIEEQEVPAADNFEDEVEGSDIDDMIEEQDEEAEVASLENNNPDGMGQPGRKPVDHDDKMSPFSNVRSTYQPRDDGVVDSVQSPVDPDEETPPTSNKRQSTSPRRDHSGIDDIIRERNDSTTEISSPLFYSPKYHSQDIAPLPHSNTSYQFERAYDKVEYVERADACGTIMREEGPVMLLTKSQYEDMTSYSTENGATEWKEFGVFAHDRVGDMASSMTIKTEDIDTDDEATYQDKEATAATTCEVTAETYQNEGATALSDVSKRLFDAVGDQAEKVTAASSNTAAFDGDSSEVDESMFLPNMKVQAESLASPPNFHQPQVEGAQGSSPLLDQVRTPSTSNDDFDESMFLPNAEAPADKSGLAQLEPSVEPQQQQQHPIAEPAASSNSVPKKDSPSNSSRASSDVSAEGMDPDDQASTRNDSKPSPDKFENVSHNTSQKRPPIHSPTGSHHDFSYVNQSMSVSSSPSVTSPPRNSNSPSVTSGPRFSPGGWDHCDNGSDDHDIRQTKKRRHVPFVSREFGTSHNEKENESSNARTPPSAKATLYSPSSTVAATVADFVAPRTKNNALGWKAERPVPLACGSSGQNKRLGGSPEHFEHRSTSNGVDDSNDERVDYTYRCDDDDTSQFDSQNVSSSRSGSRNEDGMKKRKDRKCKSKVEKKLLATIKVSDNHKPPSGLIGPSQQLEEEVWEA